MSFREATIRDRKKKKTMTAGDVTEFFTRKTHNCLHIFRVFLNLWFAKPMVWVRVAFHENDGNHENDENDEDNSDSYKQGVECWIRENRGNHENYENHENPGCKPRVPQITGLEIPEFWGDFLSKSHRKSAEKGKNPVAKIQTLQWRKFPEIADFCHMSWSNVS